MKTKKYVYDYYNVDVPLDLGSAEERGSVAINIAEENTRIYAIPCQWDALTDNDNPIVKVRRIRHNPNR